MFTTAALLLAIAASVQAVGTPTPATPPPSDVQIESPPPSEAGGCSAVIHNIQQTCQGWYESRANASNWGSFCANECFEMVRNATECLEANEDMKGTVAMLGVFDALCRRDGPGREYCGQIVTIVNAELSCDDIEDSNECRTDVGHRQCEWKHGRCSPLVNATLLDKVCSSCLRSIHAAIVTAEAENDRAYMRIAQVVSMLVTRECIKQGDEYCSVLIEESPPSTNAEFAEFCAVPKNVGCARKLLPIIVSDAKKEALRNAAECAAGFIQQGVTTSAAYFETVQEECGDCYARNIVEAIRTKFIADNICDRNSGGAFCMPLVTGESDQSGGSETVISCYRAMMNGTCDTLCNQLMNAAVSTFGCCAGLVQRWNHLEPSAEDMLAFDAAMADVWAHRFELQDHFGEGNNRRSGNDNTSDTGSMANITSSWGSWGSTSWGSWGSTSWGSWGSGSWGSWGSTSWGSWGSMSSWGSWAPGSYSGSYSYGSSDSGNRCGSGHGGGVDLSVLATCPSLANIEDRAAALSCELPRAAMRITKALRLKLNCTAVMANANITEAVEMSLAADIAAALGISVSALLNRILRCPLDSARRTGAGASYEFTIQTEDAAATTAAGTALDDALASNTLRFPALANTVSTVCTTCATAADLENFAEATTPEGDDTTSSSSIVTVMTAAVLLLLTAVFM